MRGGASRGRTFPSTPIARKRNIVRAFLAASRAGDFEALLAVLDPDVVFRADAAAVRLGPLAEIRGGKAVANTFKGRAQAAKPAIVEGGLGFPVMIGGVLKVVVTLTIDKDCITDINAIADPDRLGEITYRAFEED